MQIATPASVAQDYHYQQAVDEKEEQVLQEAVALAYEGPQRDAAYYAALLRATILENPYIPHEPTPPQALFLLLDNFEAMYGGAAGGGKASRIPSRADPLYNEAMEGKVLTPKGFVLMGDVTPGLQVCNPDGTATYVVATRDYEKIPFYRLTFADGATVEASSGHLWPVRGRNQARRRKIPHSEAPGPEQFAGLPNEEWNWRFLQRYSVTTTEQLYQWTLTGAKFAVPLPAPLPLCGPPGRWPVLPPYTVGVLIGDGTLGHGAAWSKPEPSIAARVSQELKSNPATSHLVVHGESPVYGIASDVTAGDSAKQMLQRVGLLGKRSWEKFIPAQYLHGSIESRWALAQGLFDTDGYAGSTGRTEYTTVSEQLAKDVQFLLRSLGFTASITLDPAPGFTYKGERRVGRPAYTLYVRGRRTRDLFSLPRKRDRCPEEGRGVASPAFGQLWPDNPLVSIEPSGIDSGRCIQVEHPNGLYVTDDFVVTHNSDSILMAGLQYIQVPGYAGLILRRTYADLKLPGAIMNRAMDWLTPTSAHWNENDKTWRVPGGGSLTFGYMESDNDKYRYQGAEFQYIGWDELTQFPELTYRYLLSRLRRRAGVNIPLRCRCASNPGGIGHEWVRQRFIIEGQRYNRKFVPARLGDNPYLDIEEYERSLAELDSLTRAQLREGNWDVVPSGGRFKREFFEFVDVAPAGCQKVRYWDLAATTPRAGLDPDYTVGVLLGEYDGFYYVLDVQRDRTSPRGVENLIRTTAEMDGYGVAIYMEQEPGSAGVANIDHYRRNILSGYEFRGIKFTGDKATRANPVVSQAEAHNLRILRNGPAGPNRWISAFIDELVSFPEGNHDDLTDATSGAFAVLSRRINDIPRIYHMARCPDCAKALLAPPWVAQIRCRECGWYGLREDVMAYTEEEEETEEVVEGETTVA